MAVPEGAQLDETGQWWWDGNQWQPVEGETASTSTAAGSRASTLGTTSSAWPPRKRPTAPPPDRKNGKKRPPSHKASSGRLEGETVEAYLAAAILVTASIILPSFSEGTPVTSIFLEPEQRLSPWNALLTSPVR